MKFTKLSVLFIGVLLLAGCATATPESPHTLRVMTHDSFDVSEDVIAQFEQQYHVKVQFFQAGDAGAMLNQAILSQAHPQADVLYGVDNTFLSRALNADLFESYTPQNLADVPQEFQLDPQNRVVPIDYGDVCLNYDKSYFSEHSLPIPQTLEDLTKPEYKGLLVVENPASSSPGLAFLLTTIAAYGKDDYLTYWKSLQANETLVVDGWETAYYSEFSGGAYSEGNHPLVVSYATSPAAEVYFSEGKVTEPPTGAITAPGTCYRQIEFAGILKGTPNRDLAEKFINFMLSETFQEDIPLQMWVYPVNPQASLPQVFRDFAQKAESPASVPATEIERNRKAWIEAWTDAVLRQ